MNIFVCVLGRGGMGGGERRVLPSSVRGEMTLGSGEALDPALANCVTVNNSLSLSSFLHL